MSKYAIINRDKVDPKYILFDLVALLSETEQPNVYNSPLGMFSVDDGIAKWHRTLPYNTVTIVDNLDSLIDGQYVLYAD